MASPIPNINNLLKTPEQRYQTLQDALNSVGTESPKYALIKRAIRDLERQMNRGSEAEGGFDGQEANDPWF
jgi:hypothetical protein